MKLVFVFCFTFLSLFLFGNRTDIVVLLNGDKITGEIKELKYGKLKFKTDDISTIYFEWDKIDAIYSKDNFEIITTSGAKYFGSIDFGESRKLKLISPAGFYNLYLFDVITIIPIKNSFWGRIDGSVSLGLNYTKASELAQGNSKLSIDYNTNKFNHSIGYSNLITIQSEQEDAVRQSANYNFIRILDDKFLWQAGVNWQQNSELGILSRSSIFGQYGKYLIFSGKSSFKIAAGLLLNSETSYDNVTNQNMELSIGSNFDIFSFDTPEITVSAHYIVLPSLTIKNRVRQDFSAEVKWKVIADLTFSFEAYVNTDSKPITENASNDDWGLITSIGYTF